MIHLANDKCYPSGKACLTSIPRFSSSFRTPGSGRSGPRIYFGPRPSKSHWDVLKEFDRRAEADRRSDFVEKSINSVRPGT